MSLVLEEKTESRSDKALGIFWDFFEDFRRKAYRNRQISPRELNKEEISWGLHFIAEGYLFEDLFYRHEERRFCRKERGVLLEDVNSKHYTLINDSTGATILEFNRIDGGIGPNSKIEKKTKSVQSFEPQTPRKALMAVDYEELSWEEKRDFLNGLAEYYKKHPKRFSPKKRRKLNRLAEQEEAMDRLSKGFESLIYAMKNEYSELFINGQLVLSTKRNFSDLPALSSFIWECSQKYINS